MKTKLLPRVAVNERRAYFECYCGQLHVRTAFPSTGGFDEGTPLICLHDLASTSAAFAGLISSMGTDRSIYAIDLPGHGESDLAPKNSDVRAYAAAVGDLISGLRLREVDLLGHGFGAAVAAELAALMEPVVRSVVLVDAPSGAVPAWPVWEPNEAAEDLAAVFRAARSAHAQRESLQAFTLRFATSLARAEQVNLAVAALSEWPAAERWRQMKPRPIALDAGRRRAAVADLIPGGRSLDGSAIGADMFLTESGDLADQLRSFLDGKN